MTGLNIKKEKIPLNSNDQTVGNSFSTNFTFGRDDYSFGNGKYLRAIGYESLFRERLAEIFQPVSALDIIDMIWSLIAAYGNCAGMSETSAAYYMFPELKPIREKNGNEYKVYDYTPEEAIDRDTPFINIIR